MAMFPYNFALAAATRVPPQSIPDVLATMQTIHNACVEGDGLKWFNLLYLQVTEQVEDRVAAGGFQDPNWLSTLDIQFATLYFNALNGYLTGGECPGCWSAMFAVRNQTEFARIQFALAGMNSHINHDLPFAIIATCKSTNTVPQHETPQYNDYTSLNQTRRIVPEQPHVTHLEDTLASWDLAAARESAWDSAQNLWQETPVFLAAHMKIIDGLTTVISKALLIPAP